ncbi:MAG: ferrous iron transporter B [Bacillaceae bacterium]|nr:ferrous iron transporter B [Bacillaceae bacterium]
MNCHQETKDHDTLNKNILLMGNPNVGKSVLFSKLTGKQVLTGNYSGTTVSLTKGELIQTDGCTLIDVPGTYSLQATSEAEKVAVSLLGGDVDLIICVLDSTNLERNLFMAFDLINRKVPIIFALNLVDIAERQGISIDVKALERNLGVPVVPTIATRNVGLNKLIGVSKQVMSKKQIASKRFPTNIEEKRLMAKGVVKEVQQVEERKPSSREIFGEVAMKPFPGIPIAIFVLSLTLAVVVGGGKGIRSLVLLPFLHEIYTPFVTKVVSYFVVDGVVYHLLVGEFGVLIKAFEWPVALILPYVFLFYSVLSILEDSGYLPRLGVLVDGLLRKIGVPGNTIIPFVMGYGCAVPAIIGTRAATTLKERLIVSSLVTLAIPCVAQIGAFIALLGDHSITLLGLMFVLSFLIIFVAGVILNKLLPGKVDPLLIEVPNMLIPNGKTLIRKIKMRTVHFMTEAEVPMIIGILIAALVIETGMLNSVSHYIKPIVVEWLGLPEEASIALVLGIIRRELAVLPLLQLDLTLLQMFVGSVVALLYLPCMSVLQY